MVIVLVQADHIGDIIAYFACDTRIRVSILVSMSLSKADVSSLTGIVLRVLNRIHKAKKRDPDDDEGDSSEERDDLQAAKKILSRELKAITVADICAFNETKAAKAQKKSDKKQKVVKDAQNKASAD